MTDITKTISHLIESQFPAHYRENGAELVAFIKAYYEFLETTDKYSVKMSKQMFELTDIDESLSSFISHFQNNFLSDFPSIITTDKRFAVKHILDLYSSKGSKNSLQLLLKLLYNQEVDVYYPGDDVIKASDSLWFKPQYLEITKSPRNKTFLDHQITGSASGATGFVESLVTKRINGKLIDVLYLSSVQGDFSYGEQITDDGYLSGSPTIIGSLTNVELTLGGRDNKVGDVLNVVSPQAQHGKVRVTATADFTGKVDLKILDGGYGYTSAYMAGTSDFVANTTKVYVSTAMLNVNNSANSFILYEPVLQRIEKIYLYSATNINSSNIVGTYLTGRDGSNTIVANSYVIAVANTNSNGDVISTASAYSLVTIQVIGGSTFGDQRKLTLSSPVAFSNGEYIDEESIYTLSVASTTGFTTSANVSQTITFTANGNTFTAYKAFGQVQSVANSTSLVVNKAFGPFVANASLVVTATPSINSTITSTSTTTLGARGLVTNRVGSNVDVRIVYGAFLDANATFSGLIYGNTTKLQGTISSNTVTGAAYVYLNNVNASNGSIGAPAGKDNVTKLYANGIVVGQNTTAVGLYGSLANSFYYSATGSYYIETDRAQLVSPPKYSNGAILEVSEPLTGIRTGTGASFKLGFLENTETVPLNTDIVGANNSANTPYKDILVSGQGSGFGFVANVFPAIVVTGATANGSTIVYSATNTYGVGNTVTIANINPLGYNLSAQTITAANATTFTIAYTNSLSTYVSGGFASVSSSGSGYANGSLVTFTGGGKAGGDPYTQVSGTIVTDATGGITGITMSGIGDGYYTTPTLTLPLTGGTVATLCINMTFGYGFPKNPAGGFTNLIGDLLTFDNFLIGSIGTLTKINPGSNYNADPFIHVVNPYIASYGRSDFYIKLTSVFGSFKVGEIIQQNLLDSTTAKGTVISYDLDNKLLHVRRTSFNVSFLSGTDITGATSKATGSVFSVTTDSNATVVGDNASISGSVVVANGVATAVSVVDSGFGYVNDGSVNLESTTNPYVMTGTSKLLKQGIGSGYWKTTTSHLSSDKKIHDNKYYQEYSYDIISGLSLNRYKDVVKKILHVAGNELFGSVERRSTANLNISSSNSSIKSLKRSDDYLLLNGSNLIINGSTMIVSTENIL